MTDQHHWLKLESCRLPAITNNSVRVFLSQCYGIEGTISNLNGERDRNYKVVSDGQTYMFKIAGAGESIDMLQCQEQVFAKLSASDLAGENADHLIKAITSIGGKSIETIECDDGVNHFCRLTSWLEGELFSAVQPRSEQLLRSVGVTVAKTNKALWGFSHPALNRPLLWNMEHATGVLESYAGLIQDTERQDLIAYFHKIFAQKITTHGSSLRKSAIHNDANDNNIIVRNDEPWHQEVIGLIDFGDMVHSWLITDLANACAYAMLDQPQPLDTACAIIRGYHSELTITDEELDVLFAMIAMRLCMSVCICAYQKTLEPDNEYLSISEQPAWQTLERLRSIPLQFSVYAFQDACGKTAVPQAEKILSWCSNHGPFHSIVNVDLQHDKLLVLDTSVSSPFADVGHEEYNADKLTTGLFRAIEDANAVAGIGRYNEYRLIYDSEDFNDFSGHQRTLHLGIDIFQQAGSPVFAPISGTVFSLADNQGRFDYGGTVILQHTIEGQGPETFTFYTLYGHLTPASVTHLSVGEKVEPGQLLATMGETEENGEWPPHVHFEIISDMLDEKDTFVGVGSHEYKNVWLQLCPDPNVMLDIPDEVLCQPLSDAEHDASLLNVQRGNTVSDALSLSYQQPILMAKGAGQYLFDYTGRRYLDAVNNVPHVGHCHPHVTRMGSQAAKVLSTNTRYLYPQLTQYTQRLLRHFPAPLNVVFLVNSGSEANDLALRLARAYTNRKDIIVLDHAYHGNLTSLINLSPYKHDGPGGKGPPSWVHKATMPDGVGGAAKYNDDNYCQYYVEEVERLIDQLPGTQPLAAFISESILGCGGQVVLPPGYLQGVYQKVRQVGGLCIADEVQTGFGRVGSHFWAFETQDVVPDIVTLGKPAGNGHPLAAVVTTTEVAEAFNNGMEYFNTFGGNPVSCAIGLGVLDVIEQEKLQDNALVTGNYLKSQLTGLSEKYDIIADVRGLGLFIGVALANGDNLNTPAAVQASYIAERMKQLGVLISTDGPDHNVLKIKPPIVFNHENVDFLIGALDQVLSEKWALPN